MTNPSITQKQLKNLLHYNPETGVFTWLENRQCVKKGDCAGWDSGIGYMRITVMGKTYYSHQLAFLYMTGDFAKEIDHINRSRGDNRWGNLRETNRSENMLNSNMYPSNTTGFRGVSPHKNGGFVANITINKKRIYLGKFKTPEEAYEARLDAENTRLNQ